MDKKIIAGTVVVTLGILGGIIYFAAPKADAKDYTGFAQCLKAEGALFYGAFWCSHCADQKAMFNSAALKELPYVECSTPDGKSQTEACKEKKIESYPTWVFKDGTIRETVLELGTLASTTGCVLPE